METKDVKDDIVRKTFTPNDYVTFWKTSCIRDDFTSQYFMLGMTEEASEVLEEIRKKESFTIDVLKECGDVLWYLTGMILRNGLNPDATFGIGWTETRQSEADEKNKLTAALDLVQAVGVLAGRLKKYERGDFGKDQLRAYVTKHAKIVSDCLSIVCETHGGNLALVARQNKEKITRRLEAKTIRGDGSSR